MPAIQIDRLNQQLNTFLNPSLSAEEIAKNLAEVMEAHANLSYRPGNEIQANYVILSFQLGSLVLFHIQRKIIQLTEKDPEKALTVADLIWEKDYLELKQMAAVILGNLPYAYNQQIFERLEKWFDSTADKQIHYLLFKNGTALIRQHNQQLWISTLKDWITSRELKKIQAGIKALEVLTDDPGFDNYPVIFTITDQVLELKNEKITNNLLKIYQSMIKQEANETSYFLMHSLLTAPTEQKLRFVKKCIPAFPENLQKQLRDAIKG